MQTTAVPDPADGQVLCRTLAITIGAGQRARLQGSASYAGVPQIGGVMGGAGVAQVETSRADDFAAGDLVMAPTGLAGLLPPPSRCPAASPGRRRRRHCSSAGSAATPITAYFGLLDIGAPKQGETVVVSAGRRIGRPSRGGRSRSCRAAASSASRAPRPNGALLTDEAGLRYRRELQGRRFPRRLQGRDPGPHRHLLRQHRRRRPGQRHLPHEHQGPHRLLWRRQPVRHR